jgi:hypothetical protein
MGYPARALPLGKERSNYQATTVTKLATKLFFRVKA